MIKVCFCWNVIINNDNEFFNNILNMFFHVFILTFAPWTNG